MRSPAGLWAAGLAASLLAACATTAPPAEGELKLTASGRLAVRVDADAATSRPAQSLSAHFEWRGDGERGALTLLSPLGTQLALASWSPGRGARLVSAEGEARFATLEELAERALGERVPLAAWPDWLAGRPWPGAPATALAAPTGGAVGERPAGAPAAGFVQLGWSVDLARHAEGRLEARRSQAPVVTVRIVLDEAADGTGTGDGTIRPSAPGTRR